MDRGRARNGSHAGVTTNDAVGAMQVGRRLMPGPGTIKAAWIFAHRWKSRIFFAIGDQGCASAANFLLTILYAAWLPLDGFGRYVVVWTISILVESFQIALIMDSLPAIVSRHGRRNRQRIDAAGMWVVLIYGGTTSLVILAAIPLVAIWTPHFTVPLLCLALVNPFQRLYIFFRRLCYIRDRQDAAAAASMGYGLALVAGAFGLHHFSLLSVPAAVLLWGLANGVAIVIIYGKGLARLRASPPAMVAWLTRRLWRSGRWLTGSAIGYWITNWGIFPIIGAMAGLETAGILRALQNIFTPIIQFNAALNLAILPRVADKIVAVGQHYARTFAFYGSAVFLAIVLVYGAVVLAESNLILGTIYRKPEIIASTHLLWPFACGMVVESARQATSMALLAAGRTRVFFLARLAGITVFVAGSFILTRFVDFQGVLWASVIADTVAASALVSELFRIKPGIGAAAAPDRNLAATQETVVTPLS
jgi:O-antigen/teichoic acid export membrane protein